ncbi:MAG TPA: preprotein translocase subunit YajC, partial [Bacteroidota bacterium]|nr:preprotein translocase subunit YajC [Bacteroidota bacterium]
LIAMAPAQGGQGGGDFMTTILMFAVIIGIFYFMILRPQQKRQKERQKLLDAIKKGDRVVTSGGIHGTIMGIEEKTVLLQIADNVKVKVERNSISIVNKVGEVESPS